MSLLFICEEEPPNGPAPVQTAPSEAAHFRPDRQTPVNGTAKGPHFPFANETLPALTAEHIRLRNTVVQAHEQKGVRSVLVTGTGEGVGVTSVAAGLALALG